MKYLLTGKTTQFRTVYEGEGTPRELAEDLMNKDIICYDQLETFIKDEWFSEKELAKFEELEECGEFDETQKMLDEKEQLFDDEDWKEFIQCQTSEMYYQEWVEMLDIKYEFYRNDKLEKTAYDFLPISGEEEFEDFVSTAIENFADMYETENVTLIAVAKDGLNIWYDSGEVDVEQFVNDNF